MRPVNSSSNAQRTLGILTPYLLPAGSRKISNVGNGIILRAVERHLSGFPLEIWLSSFAAPQLEETERLSECSAVVIAGANLLDDHFAPWPGLTAQAIRNSGLIFVPMGVGLHGEGHRNKGMSENTRQVLDVMHERARYSSWRCPVTLAYLVQERPKLASHFLMTGCPVLYDRPLLESTRFEDSRDVVAVTVTERDDFWARETATIDFAARSFPSSRKILALHQDYLRGKQPRLIHRLLGQRLKTAYGLRRYAMARGFSVKILNTHDEAIAFYRGVGMHIGSRLHAHLLMLSLNKRSFLIKVDERSTGIAQHLGFPLCDPEHLTDCLGFDFEMVRQAALRTFPVMQKFIDSIPRT